MYYGAFQTMNLLKTGVLKGVPDTAAKYRPIFLIHKRKKCIDIIFYILYFSPSI
jgi:hypothetical protein